MAFVGTVRALESLVLRQLLEGFLGNDVAAGDHHGRVRIGGLFLADGADKDGVEVVLARQWDFDGEFVLRGPFCALFLHDALHLEEVGEGDCAGCCGDEEGRVGAEAEEGAELAVKGVGDFFPGGVVVEVSSIGRVLQVLPVGHCAHELLYIAGVALLEDAEFAPCICPCVEWTIWVLVHRVVLSVADKETYKLQPAKLKLEITASCFQGVTPRPRPLYRWFQIPLIPQLVQYVVHFGKLLLQFLRVKCAFCQILLPRLSQVRVWCVQCGLGMWRMPIGFFDEGGCDAKLAFTEEVHSYGAVDERGVR